MIGGAAALDRLRWRRWVLLAWLAAAVLLVWSRFDFIRGFALGDTDDNIRIMQVRALIGGQGWFDLRQYRLDPPFGANIHWSRLVDLPIAGIILALKPLFGGRLAEQAAVAIAPMLPMGMGLASMALIARRMIAPRAFLAALAILLCAHSTRGMWSPLRIDHHGWQLAMLALAALALTDPRRARGGLLLGLATAASLAIGLEMLVYLAATGAIAVLLWVWDRGERPRLLAYGASLCGGTGLAFLLFVSDANRAAVCDALSPVWLSAMVGASAAIVLLALSSPADRWVRFGLAAVAGGAIAAGLVMAWPGCLGRPEGVSPELERLWLSNVREAKPLYSHNIQTVASIAGLPLAGLIGYAVTLRRRWRFADSRLIPWAALAALAVIADMLLLWQTRAGPAAQLLAVPGATALFWMTCGWSIRFFGRSASSARGEWLRQLGAAAGIVVGFLLISGLTLQFAANQAPRTTSKNMAAVSRANGQCPTLAALRPIARQPKGYVLTFVDLGPRLIAVTHHDAVAGPYHRNGEAIIDVMRAFRATPDAAHRIVSRRKIDYVLICPNLSESTVYRTRAPNGFYAQLASGRAPAWLQPVSLPANSPYRMWRVIS